MKTGIIGLWHVGCILLLSSCFRVKPAWEPPEKPPEVLSPPTETVRKDLSLDTNLFVVATDPDGDDVFIIFPDEVEDWLEVLPQGSEQLGNQTAFFRSARITEVTPALDGRQVRAVVTDFNHAPINVYWELVVPQ